MRKHIIILLVLVLAPVGCSAIEEAAREGARDAAREEVAARASQSDPEPKAEAGTYGSDPHLDALQDACGDGDRQACDDLFWESPLDSEYEAFAQEHRYPDLDDVGDIDISADMVFTILWEGMTPSEQDDICLGYEFLGVSASYEAFMDGFLEDGSASTLPSQAEFQDFFDATC